MTRTDVGFKCPEHAGPATSSITTSRQPRSVRGLVYGVVGLVLVLGAAVLAFSLLGGDDDGLPTAAPVGAWDAIADLSSIRGTPTVATLADGRVLAAGGGVGAIALSDVEILTGAEQWQAATSMISARRGHAMIVMADGRVLVSGGISDGTILSSAEIYDPGADTWEAVGEMTSPRLGHTLSLLPDGRIIAIGGTTPGSEEGAGGGQTIGPSPSTDMFDGAVWSSGPDMAVPRFEHTATMLDDGRILIVGGFGPGQQPGEFTPQRGSEIFDPAVDLFIDAAPLVEARANHASAVLDDGRVLVVSGRGGSGGSRALSSAEVYDPRRGGWTSIAAMETPRTGAAATRLESGRVLVTGGESVEGGSRRSLVEAELLDPDTGRWSPAGDMSCPRSEHSSVLVGKVVLAIAGDAAFPGQPPVAASCVDRFTPEEN